VTFNPPPSPLGPFTIYIALKPPLAYFRPVLSSVSFDTLLSQILPPQKEEKLHCILFPGASTSKSASAVE